MLRSMDKPAAILYVMSNTHTSRGDPLPGKYIRENLQECYEALQTLAANALTFGYCDEDYGWVSPLDDEALRALRSRPDACVDGHEIFFNQFECASVILDVDDWQGILCGDPVDRETLFDDWYDNYGSG